MSDTPIPPDLLESLREDFAVLKGAQFSKDIALVSGRRKSDNKPVAIVCSIRFEDDDGYTISPLAVLGDDSFFDEFDFDDDFLEREESFQEESRLNELMERCIPGMASSKNGEERIVALLNAIGDPSSVPEVLEDGDDEVYRSDVIEWALHDLLTHDALPDHAVTTMQYHLSIPSEESLLYPYCDIQIAACDVLAHMGERAKPALEELQNLLSCSESDNPHECLLSLKAASTIRHISGDSRPAMAVGTELLHSQPISNEELEKWTLVVHAAKLLGSIGPEASEAVSRLQELLDHEDENVRVAVENALQRIE